MKTKETKFSFSEGNIQRLKALNIKLKNEEARILIFANHLQGLLEKQKNERIIDDFNFCSSLSVFSNNTACNKRNNVEHGDPIWIDKTYSLFLTRLGKEEILYSENWNEFHSDHPLGKEFFCYSMHCICFHSKLNWQDIVDIEDVWIELKVDYQFFVEHNQIS